MNCKSTLLREIVEQNSSIPYSSPSRLEAFYRNIKHRLIKVARNKGVSLSSLIYSMQLTCFSGENEWSTTDNTLLMIQLQRVLHSSISAELNLIVNFACQVEETHGTQLKFPSDLPALLDGLREQLKTHYDKVEKEVFEKVGAHQVGSEEVNFYLLEHENIRKLIERISEITDFLGLPENADQTWRDMYVGLYNFFTSIEEYLGIEHLILRRASTLDDSTS